MNPVAVNYHLRPANESDRPTLNAIYASLGFMPWDPQREQLLVAEHDKRVVGCGRLHRYDDGSVELGGMYVHPDFRSHGIARSILQSLVVLLGDQTCYCIPFVHLVPFYEEYGFKRCDPSPLPASIQDKVAYFRDVYMHPTTLLVRN